MESQHLKWVTISYAAAALLMGYLLFSMAGKLVAINDVEAHIRNIDLILRVSSAVLALLFFVGLYRNDRVNQFMHEVVVELTRVTWPTPKETGSATFVVIVMVLISGIVLGLLDFCWVQLLKRVL